MGKEKKLQKSVDFLKNEIKRIEGEKDALQKKVDELTIELKTYGRLIEETRRYCRMFDDEMD